MKLLRYFSSSIFCIWMLACAGTAGAEESAAIWLIDSNGDPDKYLEESKTALQYSRDTVDGITVLAYTATESNNKTDVIVMIKADSQAELMSAVQTLSEDDIWKALREQLASKTGRIVVSNHIITESLRYEPVEP